MDALVAIDSHIAAKQNANATLAISDLGCNKGVKSHSVSHLNWVILWPHNPYFLAIMLVAVKIIIMNSSVHFKSSGGDHMDSNI